jgi:uncharacterized protein (TIGR02453 family)
MAAKTAQSGTATAKTARSSSFTGIPQAALDFYVSLHADNTRSFWQANKATFEQQVRAPVQALCDELAEFGPFHLFRPHNDLRFSKNKPPYKDHQGAFAESEGGAGYYLHVGADGLLCGAGYYSMAADQLARFRDAVDDDRTGAELVAIGRAAERAGYRLGAMEELKTAPRGYAKDHPRIDHLRRKGLMGVKEFGNPAWLHTRQAAAKVRSTWQGLGPLIGWLDTHVGPSTLPPPDLDR